MTSVKSASYSEYAPLRYEITRPFCKKISEVIRRERFLRDDDTATTNYSRELWSTLAKSVEISPNRAGFATNELRYAEAYADFFENDRIIFDFSKKLLSALIETDADKIPLKSIKFPATSFYIHFGKMEWPESFPIKCEGVYVSKHSKADHDVLDFTPVNFKKFMGPLIFEADENIDTTKFNICVDDEVQNVSDYFETEEFAFKEHIEELRNFTGDDTLVKFMRSDKLDAAANALLATIVVNCLLFISAAPDDIEQRWDDRAPRELVIKSESAEKDGARKSASNSLEKKDYIKIKLIGKRYEQHNPLHHRLGSKQVSHIRRGHFRNQAYGSEWSMHRVIFIPPAMINAGSDDLPGRIIEA